MASIDELYNQSEDLRDEGKYEEAIQKCLEILEQDANYVLVHLQLSHLYSLVEKPDEAVRHGEQACNLEPNDAQNFRMMSVTYRKAYTATQNEIYIQKAEDAMARAATLQ